MTKQIRSEGFDPEKGLVSLGEIFDEAVKKGKEGSGEGEGEGEAKKKASTKAPKKTAKKTKEVSPVPESPVEGYIRQLQEAFKDFPGDATETDAAHKQRVIIEFAIDAVKEILRIDNRAESEKTAAYQEFLDSLEGIHNLLTDKAEASQVEKRVAFVKDKVESDIAPILKRGFRPVNVPGPDSQGTQESPEQKEIKRFYKQITERLAALPSGADLELLRNLDFEINALAGVVFSFADNRKSNASERSKALIIARDLSEIHFYIEEALKKGTIDMTGSWALDIVRHRIIPMIQGDRPDAGYDGNSVIAALRQRSEAERQKLREPQILPAKTDQTATSTKAASTPTESGEVTEQARLKTEMQKFEDEVNDSPEFQAIIAKLGGLQNLRRPHKVGRRMVQGRDVLNTILSEFRYFKSKRFSQLAPDQKRRNIEQLIDNSPDVIEEEFLVLLDKFFPIESLDSSPVADKVIPEAVALEPEAVPEKKVSKFAAFRTKLSSATSAAEFLTIFQEQARDEKLGLDAEEGRKLTSLYESLSSINAIAHTQYFLAQPADSRDTQLSLMLSGAASQGGIHVLIVDKFQRLLMAEIGALTPAPGQDVSGKKEAQVTDKSDDRITMPPLPKSSQDQPKEEPVPEAKAEASSKAGRLTPGNAMEDGGFVAYMQFRAEQGDDVSELDMAAQVELYEKAHSAAELMIAGGYEILPNVLRDGKSQDFEENMRRHFFRVAREYPSDIEIYTKTAKDFKDRKANIARLQKELHNLELKKEGNMQAIEDKEREMAVFEKAKKSSIFSGVKAAFERVFSGRKVSQVKDNIERLELATNQPGLPSGVMEGLDSEITRLKNSISAREEYSARLEAEKLIEGRYDRGLFASLFFGRTTARMARKELKKLPDEIAAITVDVTRDATAMEQAQQRLKEIKEAEESVYRTVRDYGQLYRLARLTMQEMYKNPAAMAFDDLIKARAAVIQLGGSTDSIDSVDSLLAAIKSELMKKLANRTREVLERAGTQKQGAVRTLKQGLGPVFSNKDVFGVKDERGLRAAVDDFLADYATGLDKARSEDQMKLLYLRQLRDEFGTKQ